METIKVQGIAASLVPIEDNNTILLALNDNEAHVYHATLANSNQAFASLYPMLGDKNLYEGSAPEVILFGRYMARLEPLIKNLESSEVRKSLLEFAQKVCLCM
jgi:hypothetical protein